MVYFSLPGIFALLQLTVPVIAGSIRNHDEGLYTNSGFIPNLGPKLSTLQKGKLEVLWNFKPQNSTPEEFMSTPLLLPTSSLLLGSSTNTLYLLSPSGTLLASRQLRPPSFPCGDMRHSVGILGTPAIDARSNTGYVYAKGPDGYHLHAFDLKTLEERTGWPLQIDGPASNDASQYLNSTMLLQRPALTLINGVLHAAFGGGCGDHLVIVSGWVVSTSVSGHILSRWSTLGSSIWHAGASMSSDTPSRLYLATANGAATSPWEGSILRLDLDKKAGGVKAVGDVFRPWDYLELDESQRDIGASTASLTGFVMRGRETVVAGGKGGVVYILAREDLGGYGEGVDGANRVLQEWSMPETRPGVRARLFYGVGSWPMNRGRGGYLYIRPLDVATVLVYEFDSKRGFRKVVQTEESAITALGSGGPVVTTSSASRDGILWVVDLRKGLMAWDATPRDGKLTPLDVPQVVGGEAWTYKFQRPVFAEQGRVYVVAREGGVVAFGAGRGRG